MMTLYGTPLAVITLSLRNPCYGQLLRGALVLLADAVNDDKNFVQSGNKETYQLNTKTRTGDASRICTLAKPIRSASMSLAEWGKQRLRKIQACQYLYVWWMMPVARQAIKNILCR